MAVPITWRAARSKGSPWPPRSRPRRHWGAPHPSCPSASAGSRRRRWASGTRTAPGTLHPLAGYPPGPVAEIRSCKVCSWRSCGQGMTDSQDFWNVVSAMCCCAVTLKMGLLRRILLNLSSAGFFAMLAIILSNVWYALVTLALSSYK